MRLSHARAPPERELCTGPARPLGDPPGTPPPPTCRLTCRQFARDRPQLSATQIHQFLGCLQPRLTADLLVARGFLRVAHAGHDVCQPAASQAVASHDPDNSENDPREKCAPAAHFSSQAVAAALASLARSGGHTSSTGSRAAWASGISAAPVCSPPTLHLSQQREARAGSLTRWRRASVLCVRARATRTRRRLTCPALHRPATSTGTRSSRTTTSTRTRRRSPTAMSVSPLWMS